MKPENVNPGNFELIEIIYDNTEFSIAYGIFEKGNKCIGMRWNGNANDHNDKGYPKVFKNPMWFIVHQDLMKLLLKGLLGENNSNKKALLEALETEL